MVSSKSVFASLATAACVLGNPLKQGEYRIEHPDLPDHSDLKAKIVDGYYEDFQYDSLDEFKKNWVTSELVIEDGKKSSPGLWTVEEALLVPGFSKDLSLCMATSGERSSIIHRLEKPVPVNADGKPLVVQFEAQLQQMLKCGGGYMKLYANVSEETDLTTFDFSTPFDLLFGPDNCKDYTDEIHLITKDVDGVNHLCSKTFTSYLISPFSTLYTLILDYSNETYEIRLNGRDSIHGTLHENFLPAFMPEQYLYTEKPADWDDAEFAPDLSVSKPADWDDRVEIADPMHMKPPNWDESEPEMVEDLEATVPSFWNETVNGKWIRPLITNPKCYSETGCGKYKQVMIKNPEYQGEWEHPLIANPNFKGAFEPQQYENPKFTNVNKTDLYKLAGGHQIEAIAFDLLSSASSTLFDNIYIGNSVEEAELIGNATLVEKLKLQISELKKDDPVEEPVEETAELDEPVEQQKQKTAAPAGDEEDLGFIEKTVKKAMDLFLKYQISNPWVVGVLIVALMGVRYTLAKQLRDVQEQAAIEAEAAQSDSKGTTKTTIISKDVIDSTDEYIDELEISIIEETVPTSTSDSTQD